jgi:hypothetical protein
MYILMYAMVNAFNNVFNSFNQIYMAALMTSSMILIELPLMSSMYKSRRLNVIIIAAWCDLAARFFHGYQKASSYLRSAVPAFNDSASRRSNTDVPANLYRRPRD